MLFRSVAAPRSTLVGNLLSGSPRHNIEEEFKPRHVSEQSPPNPGSARLLRRSNVGLGPDSDFLPLMRLALKAGTPRKGTVTGRGLKTAHADALCKQRRRASTMNHCESQKTRTKPWNKRKLIGSKPPLRTKTSGRRDQPSGGEAHPGFDHVHCGHRRASYAAAMWSALPSSAQGHRAFAGLCYSRRVRFLSIFSR